MGRHSGGSRSSNTRGGRFSSALCVTFSPEGFCVLPVLICFGWSLSSKVWGDLPDSSRLRQRPEKLSATSVREAGACQLPAFAVRCWLTNGLLHLGTRKGQCLNMLSPESAPSPFSLGEKRYAWPTEGRKGKGLLVLVVCVLGVRENFLLFKVFFF